MTDDDSLGKKGWGKWGQTTILGREAIESAPMGRSPNPTDLAAGGWAVPQAAFTPLTSCYYFSV
jgi:hypothetical protein